MRIPTARRTWRGAGDYWGMEYTQEMANTMLAAAIDAGIWCAHVSLLPLSKKGTKIARLPSLQVERRLEPRAHRADDGDARPRARLLGQHGGGHGARTHRGAPLYGRVARLEGHGLGVGRALPLVEMRALAQRGLVRSGLG